MENNSSPVYRIDERVFYTMGLFSMMFFLILIYSYQTRQSPDSVYIRVSDSSIYVGSLVTFRAESKGGNRYEWDFGDNSKLNMSRPLTSHVYTGTGIFRIRVTVDGRQSAWKNVIVSERPIPALIGKYNIEPDFIYPKTARVNQLLTFKDTTHGATSWEWFFDQADNQVDATSREASWAFLSPGIKSVYLRVNGRQDMVSMRNVLVVDHRQSEPKKSNAGRTNTSIPPKIIYLPASPDKTDTAVQKAGPTEVRKPLPDIQADEMEVLLEEVVKGTKTPDYFSKYLCDSIDVPVTYNNEKITFDKMCNSLKQIKSLNKIRRPVVLITKNKQTGCIVSMDVTVTNKNAFQRITDKIFK